MAICAKFAKLSRTNGRNTQQTYPNKQASGSTESLRVLHSDTLGDIDKLAIKDNFNTLIESIHGLVWAASRTTQTPQCKVQHTEPRPVWRLLLAYLDPTSYGFILENIESQTPTLKLVPPESMMEEQDQTRTV